MTRRIVLGLIVVGLLWAAHGGALIADGHLLVGVIDALLGGWIVGYCAVGIEIDR